MRFILFKGPIGSLNHFIDEVNIQLMEMGHDTFISNVSDFNAGQLMAFCAQPVQAAICYDGISAFDQAIYNHLDIAMVNIFMDHPMSFASCMTNLPAKYILLMPDEYHVEYAKRFYHTENTYFLPHMASLSAGIADEKEEGIQKDIEVLFPGGYRSVNDLYHEINERFQDSVANRLALQMMEYLIANPMETMEGAFDRCLSDNRIEMPDELMASFLDHAKLLDHFIRMYYRSKVLGTVMSAGIPITILGGGWAKFAPSQVKNVTMLSGTDFTGVFPYMERAKITLNVMPWFKAGTHDRIFNSLLHASCPLTDKSTWLTEHFAEDRECAFYSLEELDRLPEKIYAVLNDVDLRKSIIQNGRKKVMQNYTSKQITESILERLSAIQVLPV